MTLAVKLSKLSNSDDISANQIKRSEVPVSNNHHWKHSEDNTSYLSQHPFPLEVQGTSVAEEYTAHYSVPYMKYPSKPRILEACSHAALKTTASL